MAPSGMRFISPDGRPLSQLLDGNRDDADSGRAKRGSHRSRKSSGSKAEQRWERAMHQGGGGGGGVLPGGRSEAEELELEAISKVGRERRRRWLNDKILRDMAGALTAPDMAGLFQPPPFGGPIPVARPTVLQAAALPQNVPLWDLFRNIDMEKQHKVLVRWEQHVAEKRRGGGSGGAPPSAALLALRAWARTARKARDALRRAPLEVVHALEARIIRELLLPPAPPATPPATVSAPPLSDPDSRPGTDTEPAQGTAAPAVTAAVLPPVSLHGHRRGTASVTEASRPELQLGLPDGFHRLLVHGIAQFHGLASFSRDTAPQSAPQPAAGAGSTPHDSTLQSSATNATPGATGSDSTPLTVSHQGGAAEGGSGSDAARDATALAEADNSLRFLRMEAAAQGEGAGPQPTASRITIVRQHLQGPEQRLADDAITVADILLVMDQREEGNLTAAMLELPGTPASETYGPPPTPPLFTPSAKQAEFASSPPVAGVLE